MNYLDIIQSSIDYIEENLKTEITAQELANRANFSLFHFYRLFRSATGMPVMQFIIRRKLLNAIYEVHCGGKMIEVGLEYGFYTHAGFYKAFKREIGYTPTQFLKGIKVNKPFKVNLFTEEYIMITHKKISQILKNWNLEDQPIKDLFYESSGVKSDNAFYVGDDYVIKFSTNSGALYNNIEVSKALESVGAYTATPVKTVHNQEVVQDGELYYVVTKRLQGSCLKTVDMYEGDYKAKARFVGEVIGHLSLALKDIDVVVNDNNMLSSVKDFGLPKTKNIINISDSLVADYLDTFGKLYDKLPKQIVHRDPNPSNIILADERWGIIDFDLSERNVRIFDPCYAATAILSESFDEKDNEKLLRWIKIYKNILYGYDSVAKLSDDEKKAVPYVVLSNMFICTAWFSEQEKYKHIFETEKKMTRWICDNFDKLTIE